MAEWSKAIDLKSIILWMRRFKSCHCRFCKFFFPTYILLRDYNYIIEKSRKNINIEDNVAEWLRRLPAKQFPSGSVGSNPAVVVFLTV